MIAYPLLDNRILFRARMEAAKRVKLAMEQHKLPKEHARKFRFNDAVAFIENAKGVLKDKYFVKDTNKRDEGAGQLNLQRTDKVEGNCHHHQGRRKALVNREAQGGDTTKAKITTNEDAQEEVNQ